jgi:hypothetical protein
MLGGCTSLAPHLEANFGDAVLAATMRETLDPDGGGRARAVAGLDGEAANAAVKRYQKSFANPAPPTSVFTIGVSGAGAASHP